MRHIQNTLEISVRRDYMWWTVFETIVSLFESCVVIHFICAFLKHDFKTVRGKIVYIIGVIIDFAAVIILNSITVYEGLLGIIYILVYLIFSSIFLKGEFLQKIFTSFLTNIILVCTGLIVSGIISTVYRDNLSEIYDYKSFLRMVSMLINQLLLICVYNLVLKYKVSMLKKKEWHLILSVLGISFVSLALIHFTIINSSIETEYTKFIVIAEFGIIILNIVCFYMTYALNRSNSEAENLRVQKQQEEYRTQYSENIRSQYEEIRRIRHDMKQNLAVISALYKEGKYKEAGEYIDKISYNLAKLEMFIDVGNDFINAILNSKLSIAKEHGIEVLCVSSSNMRGVEDTDLCNLLGNMLDNAIEAAGKCNNSLIEVSINSDDDKIHVMISNSIKESVLKNNCDLVSTKDDDNTHGYGIKTIKSIAEKYSGIANFYEDKNMFYCQVIMYKQML